MQNRATAEAYAAGDSPSRSSAPTSSVAWPAIIAGAFAATGLAFALFFLGSALGFAASTPWTYDSPAAKAFTVMSVVWLIIVQWLASAFGGYLTGRLRVRWTGAHPNEVFFRDTVHGFLSWATATVAVAVFVASLAGAGLASSYAGLDANGRPIVSSSDSEKSASRRVGRVTEESKAGEEARKKAALGSLFICLSLLIGAFVASAAGALGGMHRDTFSETGSFHRP